MSDFQNLFIEKYRPKNLNDIVLSKDDRSFFESLAEKQEIPHLLFAGIQGSGKTSLSKIIINDILKCDYLYINASDETGIDTIRSKVIGFARTRSFDGNIKIVLLDEADSISFEAMKCLRNVMEEFSATCRFILTCNYLHKIIPAIQSRCTIINLVPPIEGIVQRIKQILVAENITLSDDQKPLLLAHIRSNFPDLRRIINDVQKFSITGSLQIKNDSSASYAKKLLDKILNKQDLISIRKDVIENEKSFSGDYRNLQKQLFEIIFESQQITNETKTNMMLVVSKGLELDAFVVDKEINCFTTIINLSRNIP
jgi:DNA polymerase III delta prime subunit